MSADELQDAAEQSVLEAFQRMWPDFGWDGCYDLDDLLHHAEGQLSQEREDAAAATTGDKREGPPPGYVVPPADERCTFTMDACTCMKRKGHDGRHACAHGGWTACPPQQRGE